MWLVEIFYTDKFYCMVVRPKALKLYNIVMNIRTILAKKLEL